MEECYICGKLNKNKFSEIFKNLKSQFETGKVILPSSELIKKHFPKIGCGELYLFHIQFQEEREITFESKENNIIKYPDDINLVNETKHTSDEFYITFFNRDIEYVILVENKFQFMGSKEYFLYSKQNNPSEGIGYVVEGMLNHAIIKIESDMGNFIKTKHKPHCDGCGKLIS